MAAKKIGFATSSINSTITLATLFLPEYSALSSQSCLEALREELSLASTRWECASARLTHNLSKKFYGGGGENSFKEGRDDTAAGISSIKPFFNQEVVIVSMSIVTAWHDLEKQGPLQRCLL